MNIAYILEYNIRLEGKAIGYFVGKQYQKRIIVWKTVKELSSRSSGKMYAMAILSLLSTQP